MCNSCWRQNNLLKTLRLLSGIVFVLVGFPACAQTNIMLIGDSFWQQDGIRQEIYDGLTKEEVAFDFVGSEGRGTGPAGTTSSVTDPDHEGIGSKQFIHVLDGRTDDAGRKNTPLADLLVAYSPDIVAVQAGVNDIYWNFADPPSHLTQSVGRSNEDILSDIDAIARLIHEHDDSVYIIFTTVTPVGDAVNESVAMNERIEAYNLLLADKIEELVAEGLNLLLVDSYGAWGGTVEGHVWADALHPNEAGSEVLAAAWVVAIQRAVSNSLPSDSRDVAAPYCHGVGYDGLFGTRN